jgi:hypothetical protein
VHVVVISTTGRTVTLDAKGQLPPQAEGGKYRDGGWYERER